MPTIALEHSHTGLAYLIVLASLLNVALALSVSKKPSTVAKVMLWSNRVLMWGGRFNIILGFVFWYVAGFVNAGLAGNIWAFASVLLWGGIEVFGKRFVKEDLAFALDGAPTGKNLIIGVSAQLLLILIIFALMSIKSLHG